MHLHDGLTPEQALRDGREAGVEAVINIGDDPSDNQPGLELTKRIPGLRTTIGRHPHSATEPISREERRQLLTMARQPQVVAIGEIGLDYHWTDHNKTPPAAQASIFRQMLALAQEAGKPVVLHTREAFEEELAILDEFPGVEGVFHCFSGNAAIAAEALARGFYISFAATVTYPNAHGVIGAASIIPLDRMLVETDAPFLPPQSRRGTANAPRYLVETVARIAALRGETPELVAATTRTNTINLFGLHPAAD